MQEQLPVRHRIDSVMSITRAPRKRAYIILPYITNHVALYFIVVNPKAPPDNMTPYPP